MKIFISYRYTGEDLSLLQEIMETIVSKIETKGHEVYCSFGKREFFAEQNFSLKEILDDALQALETSDCIFALVKSSEKSEGMLLELGYAYAKGKNVIVAKQKDATATFIPEIANQLIEFSEVSELYSALDAFTF